MKHIKYKDQFILDEGISWEALRSTYRRARGIASKVINAFKQEGRETASMMRVFNYQLRNKLRLDTRGNTPTPDEIKSALELKNLSDSGKIQLNDKLKIGLKYLGKFQGSTLLKNVEKYDNNL